MFKKIQDWIKKIIASILAVLGIWSLASVVKPPIAEEITSFNVNGRTIEMSYTDDNTDEDLIIRTEKEDYVNWAGSMIIYYSVYNRSNRDQNVKTVFSLNDKKGQEKYVKDIYEHAGQTITTEIISNIVYSTDTDSFLTTTSSVQKITTNWQKHNLSDFISPKISNRKSVKKAYSLKNNDFLLKRGETKLFNAVIKYADLENKEEFFIEAFGDRGAYGHLDPFTFEDLFNSDTKSTGDLNGQDNWSGATEYDVVTDADARYEGDQGIKVIAGASQRVMANTSVTAANDGIMYIGMRPVTIASGERVEVFIYESGSQKGNIKFDETTGNIQINHAGVFSNVLTSYSLDQWYIIAIDFDAADDQYQANVYDTVAESWVGWSGDGALADNGVITEINEVRFALRAGCTAYYDTLTGTNPIAGGAARRIITIQIWD